MPQPRCLAIVLATTLSAAVAASADAASLSAGLNGGLYVPTLEPLAANARVGDDSDSSFFVSPTASVTIDPVRFGVRYLYSSYTLFETDFDKHDIDLAAGWILNDYVTVSSGLRVELQRPSGAGVEFDILAVPVAVALSYPMRDVGLFPFLVGTVFPFATVDVGVGSGRDESLDGFAGFAIEPGVAYSLYGATELPLSVTLSYRFQSISLEEGAVQFDEQVQQAGLGLSWAFSDL